MKASETSERYEGKLRECCNYAARTAKNFALAENSKRQACGPDEKLLAEALKADLSGFADSITEEKFTANRAAYILSNLILFILMLLAAAAGICACMFTKYTLILLIVGIVFSVLSVLGFFGVFGGTSKNVDGVNIFAVRKPSEEVKKRVIIEANTDAPFKRKLSAKTAAILKTVTCIGLILYLVFDVVALLVNREIIDFSASQYFLYISFPLALFAFIPLFLSRSVIATASFPGVIDNLVSCYTAAGAMRYMSEMDLRLKNTELCVLLTGARHANFAGLKTYCKFHTEEDNDEDTLVISLDSLFNADKITVVNTNDKFTTTAVSSAIVNSGVTVSSSTSKLIRKNGSMKVLKKNGYSCATITSLEDAAPDYLGTERDTSENINVKAIENAMKLVLETAYAIDG